MYGLDLVTADLKIEDFVRIYPALLDESVATDNNKEFPLGIMPMLPFRDAWFGNVDTYLAAVKGMDKFSKGTAIVHVHLEWECHFLLRQITQVCTIEFLGKGILWNLRNHQGIWLISKSIYQIYDFTESNLMSDRAVTICYRFFATLRMTTSSTLSVPITFVLTASIGKNSQDGTCLSAAA